MPVDQQIRGFNISVDQSDIVGMLQPTRSLDDVTGSNQIGERTIFANERLHVRAVDILHHHVVRVFVVINVVGANDVGMVQRGDGFGFALETF